MAYGLFRKPSEVAGPDWIDYDAAGVAGPEALDQRMLELLEPFRSRYFLTGEINTPVSDVAPPATLEEHGRRLVDVLGLADAIPVRRRGAELRAPRLVSR